VRFYSSALEGVLNDLESDQEVAHPSGSESTPKLALSSARPASVVPMGLRQKLELKGIRFSYPNTDRPAVDGVSLEIPANAAVGFVGATGSGKTTLIDVILGLLKPEKGEIVVDGVVINDSNLKAWQKSIGYVPQHIFLTDSSVAENIAFGDPRIESTWRPCGTVARIRK